ncbi:MAG: class B sortase [Oscillospiraceae bacterium]|nr:class B sortase [Oscillospiraceae bacterium]
MNNSTLHTPHSTLSKTSSIGVRFWKKMNVLYERLVLIVLILILLIVLWCMYDNYYVFNHTTDRISGYKPGTVSSENVLSEKSITDDMVAWITLDNTGIDYPVMHSDDNVKYLNTDPFGDYSLAGSIFLDCRNSPDFTDDYSLVYGHHMEYGRMFGALDEFLDESYLRSHTTGELLIGRDGQEKHKLKVFAAVKASALDEEIFDPGKGDVRAFIKDNAAVIIEDSEERILGLSTCSDENAASRVIVFCYIE